MPSEFFSDGIILKNMTDRINHQPAFLLASEAWSESSLRIDIFSQDYGRINLIARSARKRQSELRGIIIPFVPISTSWFGKQELKTLHRAEWIGGWAQPQNKAIFSGLYLNELVLKLTALEDPLPKLYDSFAQTMQHICTHANHSNDLRYFEWQLLNTLGYAPDLHHDINGESIQANRQYLMSPENPAMPSENPIEANQILIHGSTLIALRDQRLTPESQAQALQLTRLLLDFRLPEGIKSRQILQQIQQF